MYFRFYQLPRYYTASNLRHVENEIFMFTNVNKVKMKLMIVQMTVLS